MKKLLIFMIVLCFYAFPAYGAEKFERVEPDKECQQQAGKIWRQRKEFNLEAVDVVDNVIYIRGKFTKESKKLIQEMAPDYEISFLNYMYNGYSDEYLQTYIFQAGEKFVQANGMLFELEHMPYMKDGILMVGWRDFSNLYKDVSMNLLSSEWIGGENQEITYQNKWWRYELDGKLSIKNNTVSYAYNTHNMNLVANNVPLEGKMEIKEGTAYFPLTIENLKYILFTEYTEINWSADTNTFTMTF